MIEKKNLIIMRDTNKKMRKVINTMQKNFKTESNLIQTEGL